MLALLFLAALLAFGISAVAGGGASLLLVPLLLRGGRVVRKIAFDAHAATLHEDD